MRKIQAMLLAILLLLPTAAALAEPTSQFGFSGWPGLTDQPCNPCKPCVGQTPTPTPASATQTPAAATPALPVATTVAPTPTAQPTVTPAPTARPTATAVPSMDDDYTTVSTQAQEQMLWNLLNEARKANGLAALPLDAELSRLARLKCQDMRANHYFAHESPTYGRAKDMLKSFGYAFNAVGENIAHHATAEKAHAAFLSSTDHRHNMLSSSWEKVGIGVWYDENGFVYVTQLFVR